MLTGRLILRDSRQVDDPGLHEWLVYIEDEEQGPVQILEGDGPLTVAYRAPGRLDDAVLTARYVLEERGHKITAIRAEWSV